MNYIHLFYQLLPEAVLVITALALLGVAVSTESKTKKTITCGLASRIAALGVLAAGVALVFTPKCLASGSHLIAMDAIALIFKGGVLGLGFLAVLVPPAKKEIEHPGEYFALMLFALTGLTLAVGSNHLLFIFVALELASLSLYLLAGFSRTPQSSEASLKYFLFGAVSAAFMLFGLSFLYGFSQSDTLQGVAKAVAADPTSVIGMVGLLMVVVGLGFKMAAAPFHYWAPDVYQGAPVTTVTLVAGASKIVGVVLLVRFLMIGFPDAAGSAAWGGITAGWSIWLAIIAAVSMVFGNLLALAQKSVRRLLAYSAVANSGYLMVGMCAAGGESSAAALFYVVVYGLATLGALVVTAAVERDQGSDSQAAFAGLIHRSPLLAVCLLIFMTSLAGIPPLAGFAGKFILFGAAMTDSIQAENSGLAWLVGLAVVMSAVSFYYYLSVLKQAFVKDGDGSAGKESLSLGYVLAVVIPAAALVLLGLLPSVLLDPIKVAVLETLGMH
ncbi:MAG: NADH-quinone oxidoreductase subunit N [Verrucomicrobiae bacterium]|nr:NADH-quinone oxidoreductase subunit N [Verrucomicrobiae bacterium]NNJ43060.1 NADH-quinone oxidoreductase subunit N [Akkermansiaceae bacterium]